MIVRDTGDTWQVVFQTDHAVLASDFARAWGNDRFARPRPFETVVNATARHDDGWAVWERAPTLIGENGNSAPRNFLEVQIISHLAFYRAMIASVTEDDPYAGLLVSMHGRGIYNGRYGTNPELKLTFAPDEQQAVGQFIEEQEAAQGELIAQLAVDDEERWTNYKLMQLFDRLSLYFCTKDVEAGEADSIAPAPVDYDGTTSELRIDPTGAWSVSIDPYPFVQPVARFQVPRRLLPKRHWRDLQDFRSEFFSAPVQTTEITITPR